VELLTVEEVAGILRLSKSKVYSLKERIGCVKLDGSIRFILEDVEEYVLSCRIEETETRESRPRFRSRHFA
jgi:excisionase family DNA binding protein